ncbi:MAG: hypothetical protein F6K53_40685 [Moorea sp. SIO4A1]|uniref:hypothetical protein n=1 Tax=Moorena sp. SIO4A1 TaxID=2607835 RepID=UPI00144B064C|nr:hypothetical protein [Moorena sp. SIO4A1]NEQ63316.1 hypothetical protein [Moorena sp. SIO4A1]
MGQVAGILHGSTELTGDLDLLWSGREPDAPAIAAGFAAAGADLLDDDGALLAGGAETFRLPKVLFRTVSSAGDCCTPALPWADLDVESFIARADTATIDGVTVRYVSLSDLIAMCEAVGRPKDRRRAAELRRL